MPYAVPLTVCLLALAAFHCGLTNGQQRLRAPADGNVQLALPDCRLPNGTVLAFMIPGVAYNIGCDVCVCNVERVVECHPRECPGVFCANPVTINCCPVCLEFEEVSDDQIARSQEPANQDRVPVDVNVTREVQQLQSSRLPFLIFPGFYVNLLTGYASPFLPAGMSWHSDLTQGSGDCVCDRQGVLKLTIEPGMGAEIKMTFSESFRYTFNVGDSVSNNAWAGDSNHQKNDAEVHSYSNSIYFYGRDNPTTGGSYGLVHSAGSFVASQPFTTLTLRVADQLATADNGLNTILINSFKMFALSGQADQGGVNQDVYLGMNRVVGSHWRTGRGLCRVSVRFYVA